MFGQENSEKDGSKFEIYLLTHRIFQATKAFNRATVLHSKYKVINKAKYCRSALDVLAEAMRITIARSWTQLHVNLFQITTTRQIETAVVTFKSNVVFLVDMHCIDLV